MIKALDVMTFSFCILVIVFCVHRLKIQEVPSDPAFYYSEGYQARIDYEKKGAGITTGKIPFYRPSKDWIVS